MGWASGSGLAEEIWDLVKDHLPKEVLAEVAANICISFEDHDCDTLYEAESLYTAALKDAEYFVENYLRYETFDYQKGFSYDLKSFHEWLEDHTGVEMVGYSNRMLRKILKAWEKRSKNNVKG